MILLTHILDPLPVICLGLGLDGASGEELVVLCAPHPEILHELDGVSPLLICVGPEQLGNIGEVYRVLAKCIFNHFVTYFLCTLLCTELCNTHLVKMCGHEDVLEGSLKLNPHLVLKSCHAAILNGKNGTTIAQQKKITYY